MNSLEETVCFECTKCGACCKEDSLLVTVTGRDLVRLSMILGLSSTELLRAVDFYLESGLPSKKGLRDFPALITERGPAYMALKKMEDGSCVFLKDDLCMIHSIRPAVCISFPFVFKNDGDHLKWGLNHLKHICPGLGIGPEVKEAELIEIADSVLEDLFLFREFGEEWNQTSNPTAQKLIEKILSDSRFEF
ncbi:MAG: YkgJ family cysteine cluster protein [Promethearchaeota archaeon]